MCVARVKFDLMQNKSSFGYEKICFCGFFYMFDIGIVFSEVNGTKLSGQALNLNLKRHKIILITIFESYHLNAYFYSL